MNWDWILFLLTSLGAFVLYFKLQTEGRATIQFTRHLFPLWDSPWQPVLETCLFSLIGGLVSFGLVQPTTAPQAIAAGLGWTGLLSSFARET